MARNTARANEIRNAVFGKDNREPIAKSIEVKLEDCGHKMDKIEEEHDERIGSVQTDSISGMDGYYRLSFIQVGEE